MPDPTLSAWVNFFGRTVSLATLILAGVILMFKGSMGYMEIRGEVKGLVVDVDAQGVILEKLVVSDSVQGLQLDKVECLIEKVAMGDVPLLLNDCKPDNRGESQ